MLRRLVVRRCLARAADCLGVAEQYQGEQKKISKKNEKLEDAKVFSIQSTILWFFLTFGADDPQRNCAGVQVDSPHRSQDSVVADGHPQMGISISTPGRPSRDLFSPTTSHKRFVHRAYSAAASDTRSVNILHSIQQFCTAHGPSAVCGHSDHGEMWISFRTPDTPRGRFSRPQQSNPARIYLMQAVSDWLLWIATLWQSSS